MINRILFDFSKIKKKVLINLLNDCFVVKAFFSYSFDFIIILLFYEIKYFNFPYFLHSLLSIKKIIIFLYRFLERSLSLISDIYSSQST